MRGLSIRFNGPHTGNIAAIHKYPVDKNPLVVSILVLCSDPGYSTQKRYVLVHGSSAVLWQPSPETCDTSGSGSAMDCTPDSGTTCRFPGLDRIERGQL